jgi:hypothetical protein
MQQASRGEAFQTLSNGTHDDSVRFHCTSAEASFAVGYITSPTHFVGSEISSF